MSRTARLVLLWATAVVLAISLVIVARLVDDSSSPGPGADPGTVTPESDTSTTSPASPTGESTGAATVEATPTPTPTPTPTAVPTPCPPGPERELTVLSFNIHAGLGSNGYELDTIADEINAWGADIVLLQEVDQFRDRSNVDNQPRLLAQRLGMQAAYGPNVRRDPVLDGGKEQRYGSLILSSYPVVDQANVRLPNRPGLERRGLVRATVDVDGVLVDVFNTHLQHTSGAVRRDQVRGIKDELRDRELPQIVGGDFNAEPDSPAVSLLTSWRFTDPWPVVGDGTGLTVPAGDPQRRIDFVLHDEWFGARYGDVRRSSVSDHRAVRIRLALTGPADCVAPLELQ